MQLIKSKKQKGLLVLSAFVLAITGLTTWWLNHAYDARNTEQNKSQNQAFNTKLPEANTKEAARNKLEIYMQAEKDSAKLKEQEKKDSLERRWFNPGPPEEDVFADQYPPEKGKQKPPYQTKTSVDHNERKVNDRLEKLYAALNNTEEVKQENTFTGQTDMNLSKYENNIAQLEKLQQQIQNANIDSNPEMKQMEDVLNKILDIQYPERVKERLSKKTQDTTKTMFEVATSENAIAIDTLYNSNGENAFWGLQEEQSLTSPNNLTTISAVVHQDQLLQDGSVIKLRLLQDIFINGNCIPKDNFLFGECSLGDQRLQIQFNSIAFSNIIYPVNLTAFDTDGNEGIYIPGAIGRDAAKNGMNDFVQQMQLATLNPSIGAQATMAGIQSAQNLLSKKVKRVQVTVKAGHIVLLKMKGTN